MEQNSKYFSKTIQALDELRRNADELASVAEVCIEAKAGLEENIGVLKKEIRLKADQIDGIITTLNGALG